MLFVVCLCQYKIIEIKKKYIKCLEDERRLTQIVLSLSTDIKRQKSTINAIFLFNSEY